MVPNVFYDWLFDHNSNSLVSKCVSALGKLLGDLKGNALEHNVTDSNISDEKEFMFRTVLGGSFLLYLFFTFMHFKAICK